MAPTATATTRTALMQSIDALMLEHEGKPASCEFAARKLGLTAPEFERLALEAGYQKHQGRWHSAASFDEMARNYQRPVTYRNAPRQPTGEATVDVARMRMRAEADPTPPAPRVASAEMRERVDAVFRHPLSRGRETSAVRLLSAGMPTHAVLEVLAAYEPELPADPSPGATASAPAAQRASGVTLDVGRFMGRTEMAKSASESHALSSRPLLDPGRYMAKVLPPQRT